MCSRFLRILVATLLLLSPVAAQQPLKVCADPDNLPFSNMRGQGFENRLAELVAKSLNRKLVYRWARHTGRGFVRNILNPGECDLLVGVPSTFRPVLTTRPYYRSAFVFVSPKRVEPPSSYDDQRLRTAKIGVQVVEEEYAPPAIALGRRGLLSNIVGYEAIGHDSGNLVRAVARREVDFAVVWGPLAGFYSRQHAVTISPAPMSDGVSLPLAFSISMGVRKSDTALRDQIDAVLRDRDADVKRILNRFGVPQLELQQEQARR
jgi:mxaJ protein